MKNLEEELQAEKETNNKLVEQNMNFKVVSEGLRRDLLMR